MNNLSVRWGATLPITLTIDEEGADTATLVIAEMDNGAIVLEKTAAFDGLIADLTLTAEDTQLPTDEYEYMITVVYADGTVEKYPDVAGCTECEFPTIEICEALDMEQASS
jgi:hypothetical protein